MFYSSGKRILSEGMSLEQIKQGKNPELLKMFEMFVDKLFSGNVRRNLGEMSAKAQEFLREMDSDLINLTFDNTGIFNVENLENENLSQREKAYAEYILVNVLEYNQEYADTVNINNPTNGLKGKYTEFILRVLCGKILYNDADIQTQFDMIQHFVKIFNNSSSAVYKTKNMFFDNVIIPLMDDRVAKGEALGSVNPVTGARGANFSRPSPVAQLQDKIMKVFDTYGVYNGKNLLETMIDEVVPEDIEMDVSTFAGYDIRLINYCLQKKYWKEFHVPDQPRTTRLFFIGDGDLQAIKPTVGQFELNEEAAYDSWNQFTDEERYSWGDMDNYFEYLKSEGDPAFDKSMQMKSSFNFYFIHMALTFACNIYPFKTQYNISKKVKDQLKKIPYIKSISNEDFFVPENNYEYEIRKTTSWCTKDEDYVAKYISPTSTSKVEGFILCLNDSLSFNNPDGSLQIGVELTGRNNNYHIQTLNADDTHVDCPEFLTNFFKRTPENITALLDQDKSNYQNIKGFEFPQGQKLSPEMKRKYYRETLKTANINESLLRKYLRQLLS